MLTRQIDDQSVASSNGDAATGAAADVSAGSANLEAAESHDEGWAVVSLPDGEDGANLLAGLDLDSVNQESGVSSLSGTNGGAFDGQTILGSLGPGDDDDNDDDDDMLLLDTFNSEAFEREDADNLSIPDTVPSNIRSIRSARNSSGADRNAVGGRERRPKKQYGIVLIAFLALLSFGAAFLASTWRQSALRLEAELDALRNNNDGENKGIINGDARNKRANNNNNHSRTSTWESRTFTPPLFGEQQQHEEGEATPFTVADNCYIKATASVSLGTCGSELKDNIQNASATVLYNIANFATQFGNFWKPPHRPDRNSTSSAKVFEKLNKLWKTERDRWNKASERFASEFASAATSGARNASCSAKLIANRTAETAQHTADVFSVSAIKIADEVGSLVSSIFSSHAGLTIADSLGHTNEASIWNLFDQARDAIEESTIVIRSTKVGAAVDLEKPNRVQSRGLLQYLNLTAYKLPHFGHAKKRSEEMKQSSEQQSRGLLHYVPNVFLNLSTFKIVAPELPAFGERKATK